MKAVRSLRLVGLLMLVLVAVGGRTVAQAAGAVTVTDNGSSWTLDNGIVKATVTKNSGSMPSLIYKGKQMLAASGGTWEHNPQGAPTLTNTVTIDPATNGGTRAEVSIKGISGGSFVTTTQEPPCPIHYLHRSAHARA